MAEDSGEKRQKEKKKLAGLKTMPFILANDVCDRFVTTGFHSNLITYLTQQLNMPLVQASNTLTIFAGTASLTPLIGAFAADSFAGRFWTITVGSIIYELGMISITLSAILPTFRPSPCKTQENCQKGSPWQLAIFYISLLLTSLGSGGIRPCVVTFGADQFDMTASKRTNQSWSFFNCYYFIMGLSTLLALTVLVYIQDYVSWGWGLGIPTIAMALSTIAFVLGSPLYMKFKPAGSPFVRLMQVVVAAMKKRNAVRPTNPEFLYENEDLDAAIASQGKLVHTNQLKFFDRAAIITEDEKLDSNSSPNLWKLSTVHRVEELKSILRMVPIWSSAILLVMASSHQHSFAIQQANTMNRHLSHSFEIPAASMSIFNNLTMLISLIVYQRLFVPIARRITKNPSGITCLQRMGVGFMINTFSTIVAALVEIKRKKVAAEYNLLSKPKATIPISVFWMVPQYGMHGIAEVFMSVGHLEFMYDQSPESMRSTAIALYWITISIGNYLSTLLVSLVHTYSGKKNNWLPDRNINRGKLENYYWLVTCLQVLNLFYYSVCAWFYRWKPVEEMELQCTSEATNQQVDDGYVEFVKYNTTVYRKNDIGEEEEPKELAQNDKV